jgi:hypothetical protein
MTGQVICAKDVLEALDLISGGRCIKYPHNAFGVGNPFVVTKSSNLPGKAVTETPGLVCGDPDKPIKKLAVSMTLTESQIELAGGTGIDAIVTHHPVADAASCGGVLLRVYTALYGLALFELHEAFHGRHPGLAYLHGHAPFRVEINYAGIPGNVMFVGKALPEVKTLGDMILRQSRFMGLDQEQELLALECKMRQCPSLMETNVAVQGKIILGDQNDPAKNILHIFPHTGFSPDHLRQAKSEHPEIDTVLVSISRCPDGHPLVKTAAELGLSLLAGNSHAMEIFENGLPLAYALKKLLPGLEVVIFRERVTSVKLEEAGNQEIRDYAALMVDKHILPA